MGDWFNVLAVLLAAAAIFGLIAKYVKQPPLLGYVVAGIAFNLLSGGKLENVKGLFEGMGQMGITLLLFLAGLELPLAELKKMGRVAMGVGVTQIAITTFLGFWLGRLLGIPADNAIFLGVGLAFGSTILMVKLLSEKGELQSLHGRIAVGYLLVQDFVAIGIMLVTAGDNASGGISVLAMTFAKAAVLVGMAVWLSEKVMDKLMKVFRSSTELVFVGALGWCLSVAAVVSLPMIGFGKEIGGFLAGLALAGAMEQAQIISRVRPLRDFFITWFFVGLGANLGLANIGTLWPTAVILSLYVLIINPLIVMNILGLMGYNKRTAFLASLAVSQVSEFSLILVHAAKLSGNFVDLFTLVMMITMTISTYVIWNAKSVYKLIIAKLPILYRRPRGAVGTDEERPRGHYLLFGCHRVGGEIRASLEKLGKKLLVVDFNPKIIEELKVKGVEAVYGDMADHEMYERLGVADAEVIISTIPDLEDSLHLLDELKLIRKKQAKMPAVVLTANDKEDAQRLYKDGAAYVLVPHLVGGEFLGHVLERHGSDGEYLYKYGSSQKEKMDK